MWIRLPRTLWLLLVDAPRRARELSERMKKAAAATASRLAKGPGSSSRLDLDKALERTGPLASDEAVKAAAGKKVAPEEAAAAEKPKAQRKHTKRLQSGAEAAAAGPAKARNTGSSKQAKEQVRRPSRARAQAVQEAEEIARENDAITPWSEVE